MNLGFYIVPPDTKNGICVDIGCNLGDFTNKYKDHFQSIFYFEPQKELFSRLRDRFNDTHNVIGYNLAVWSESKKIVELLEHPNNDHGSVAINGEFINSDWTNNVVNEVETISYPDLFELIGVEKIDYLKIDCETSEYPFLFNRDLSNITYIGIELHAQLGSEKYYDLLNWIYQTHDLMNGNPSYNPRFNRELFFKLK